MNVGFSSSTTHHVCCLCLNLCLMNNLVKFYKNIAHIYEWQPEIKGCACLPFKLEAKCITIGLFEKSSYYQN